MAFPVRATNRAILPVLWRSPFLTGDGVYAQRDACAQQCDIPGVGTLIHPSLGSQQASLASASFGERSEDGRIVSVELY